MYFLEVVIRIIMTIITNKSRSSNIFNITLDNTEHNINIITVTDHITKHDKMVRIPIRMLNRQQLLLA